MKKFQQTFETIKRNVNLYFNLNLIMNINEKTKKKKMKFWCENMIMDISISRVMRGKKKIMKLTKEIKITYKQ